MKKNDAMGMNGQGPVLPKKMTRDTMFKACQKDLQFSRSLMSFILSNKTVLDALVDQMMVVQDEAHKAKENSVPEAVNDLNEHV